MCMASSEDKSKEPKEDNQIINHVAFTILPTRKKIYMLLQHQLQQKMEQSKYNSSNIEEELLFTYQLAYDKLMNLHLENITLKDEISSLKENKEKLENVFNSLREEYQMFEGLYQETQNRVNEANIALERLN